MKIHEKYFLGPATLFVVLTSLWLTTFLHSRFEFSTVIASSLVGLVFSQLFRKSDFFSASAFCASFAGMTIKENYSLIYFLSQSLIISLLLLSLKNIFQGHGGKLGSIAYISSLLILLTGPLWS